MTPGPLLRCAWLAAAGAVAPAHAAYTCKDPATGKVTIQQMPCPVVNEPPPPPPAKPPCALDAEQLKATIRRERQFLTRFADESAHRASRWPT
jgi:hypothetical protein